MERSFLKANRLDQDIGQGRQRVDTVSVAFKDGKLGVLITGSGKARGRGM